MSAKHFLSLSLLSLAAAGCGEGLVGGEAEQGDEREASAAAAGRAGSDRFGVRMIYPTKPGGRVWVSRWDNGNKRTLGTGAADPYDGTFQNRGSNTRFDISGTGVAVARPSVTTLASIQRHYIWDRSGAQKWGDIELTFYAQRVREYDSSSATGRAGFTIEARSGDGHSSDAAVQCRGYAYAATMRYYGKVSLGKELKHPLYADQGGPAALSAGEIPKGAWVGFKLVARDEDGGVRLQLFRDLTDGKNGGKWEKLLDHHDHGGWGLQPALCGRPWDYVIKGAHPIVLLRNDNAEVRYKWASIRTIHGDDDDPFTDASTSIFRSSINWLKREGLSAGCNPPFGDWYCPAHTLTRAELAAFFDRAFELPHATRDYFVDDNGAWYEAAANNLAASGISKGCNPPANDRFCPARELTRAELATFLKRALGTRAASRDYFVDDNGSVHEASINALAAAGITKGCNPPANDRFCPAKTVTRGELAALLQRALTR